MRARVLPLAILLALAILSVSYAQKPFRQYEGWERDWDYPLPSDYKEPGEWVFGRLRYDSPPWPGRYWGPLSWSIDYPRGDRHLAEGIRRLTRINARSIEQVVDFDDDIYNWPFLFAIEPGQWTLREEQAAKLRDYLLRGGFLMVDDFHGTYEWEHFMEGFRKVFPDRQVVELDGKDPIFHTVYDLDDREQVPGMNPLMRGVTYELDGYQARWRGIYDDRGRIMVAICHNMDMGDALEHSDNPRYPEKWASLAYRINVNYIMYSMTH